MLSFLLCWYVSISNKWTSAPNGLALKGFASGPQNSYCIVEDRHFMRNMVGIVKKQIGAHTVVSALICTNLRPLRYIKSFGSQGFLPDPNRVITLLEERPHLMRNKVEIVHKLARFACTVICLSADSFVSIWDHWSTRNCSAPKTVIYIVGRGEFYENCGWNC